MTLIPWRVKNFVSDRFPLLYHLVANAGARGNSAGHWDERLAETWEAPTRAWPTKNALVASLTRPADVLLDIGCGNGSILRDLKARGYERLHGLEISAYAIDRLSAEGIEMHYGVLPRIALPDAMFDVVIASQVLEHIIRRRTFLEQIRRVLKTGGSAFVFVPDDCLGPISEREHVAKYNARSLRALLERHFTVVTLQSMRDANHESPVLFAHVRKDG